MKQTKQVQTTRQLPNKYIYAFFLIVAIILVCLKDFSTAIIFGGIGLVFDPFNQSFTISKKAGMAKGLVSSTRRICFCDTLVICKNRLK